MPDIGEMSAPMSGLSQLSDKPHYELRPNDHDAGRGVRERLCDGDGDAPLQIEVAQKGLHKPVM